jgi:hypothetical protein
VCLDLDCLFGIVISPSSLSSRLWLVIPPFGLLAFVASSPPSALPSRCLRVFLRLHCFIYALLAFFRFLRCLFALVALFAPSSPCSGSLRFILVPGAGSLLVSMFSLSPPYLLFRTLLRLCRLCRLLRRFVFLHRLCRLYHSSFVVFFVFSSSSFVIRHLIPSSIISAFVVVFIRALSSSRQIVLSFVSASSVSSLPLHSDCAVLSLIGVHAGVFKSSLSDPRLRSGLSKLPVSFLSVISVILIFSPVPSSFCFRFPLICRHPDLRPLFSFSISFSDSILESHHFSFRHPYLFIVYLLRIIPWFESPIRFPPTLSHLIRFNLICFPFVLLPKSCLGMSEPV